MPGEQAFLRSSVVIEPLIHRFYIWLYNFSPAASAMTFVRSILPMMESYLEDPAVHAEAAADPRLRGGPFLDLGGGRRDEVAALVERIRAATAVQRRFVEAVDLFSAELLQRAQGHDLSGLYAELPQPLQGLVELAYDLHDQPALRFFEPLLYRSPLFDAAAQSCQLSLASADDRPFMMSTPRLPGPGRVELPFPPADPRIDALFRAATAPRDVAELCDDLGVDAAQRDDFRRLFAAEPDLAPERAPSGPGVRVRYLGHACLAIQTRRVTILTDPFISPETGDPGRFTVRDLPDRIDVCLITHGHQDHLVLETLLPLRHRIGTLLVPQGSGGSLQDPSLRLYLQQLGFRRVEALDAFDELAVDGGRIVACPFLSEHCDLDIRAKTTWAVSLEGRTIYVGADSRGVDPPLFDHIHDAIGDVDLAFIGMECDGAPLPWLYGQLFSRPPAREKGLGRKLNGSNAREALEIATRLHADRVCVYAMGREPWLQHVMATHYPEGAYQLQQTAEFVEACGRRGIAARELLWRGEMML